MIDRLRVFLALASEKLAGLRGWRRRGACFLSGALSAMALAPFYFLPFLAVGFSALIWILDGAARDDRPIRTAAFLGWWFGFGYFLVGIYWMAFSFFVQADQFAWMAPFAMLGMPAFLAFFSAGACGLSILFWQNDWRRIFVFAAMWVIFEYARGHILTGLPWNLVGQAFAGTAAGAQSAALWGAYGLSLIAVFLAVLPAATVCKNEIRDQVKPLRGLFGAVIGCGLLFLFGIARINLLPSEFHDDAYVRIVQPNIPQREKIDPTLWSRNFGRHLSLSRGIKEGPGRVFVIWPENGVPLLSEVSGALEVISQTLPSNSVLIAGSVRRDIDENNNQQFFNSVAVIAQSKSGQQLLTQYDKHHLVPFGEYLPLKGVLRAIGLAQLAPFEDGFTSGPGPRTIEAGGPSFAPLICYEAIFPGELYPRSDRPEWLLTVTNDAWFGDTSGPRQHLDQARLRSIETGLPMARAANTGISALIDARGIYVERVSLYNSGAIDSPLPKALSPTLYSQIGDLIFWVMVLAVWMAAQLWRKYAHGNKPNKKD